MRHKIALTALNLMTTHDVAKKLGVTIRSVQLWVEQGLLEGWKTPGGHRRITSESFNRFVLSQEINLEPTEFINTQLSYSGPRNQDNGLSYTLLKLRSIK